MFVRIVQQMSGSRADGSPWPPAGTVLEVSAEEGRALCHSGDSQPTPIAVPVVEERTETADAPEKPGVELRTEASAGAKVDVKPEVKPSPPPVPAAAVPPPAPPVQEPAKRGPGRPPGSVNRPKPQ